MKYGYRDSPLEQMAYDLQRRFDQGKVFDTTRIVLEMIEPIALQAEELIRPKQ